MTAGDLIKCASWTKTPGQVGIVTQVWCSNVTPSGCDICHGMQGRCEGLQISAIFPEGEGWFSVADVTLV